MKIEVKVPAVGESVTEAVIGSWTKKSGDFVKRNEILLLLETDKASVEVVAENDGILQIQQEAGQTIKIGTTVGTIDTDGKPSVSAAAASSTPPPKAAPVTGSPSATPSASLSPAVQRIVSEQGLNPASFSGTGKDGRLTKGDLLQPRTTPVPSVQPSSTTMLPSQNVPVPSPAGLRKRLVPMTNIRKRIAERLIEAQHTAAILTTFNEIDMSKVIEIRTKYKDKFKEKYGINLGFMGFFIKASVEALKAFPAVNASIVGTNIEYHDDINLGVAVSTEKGLLVPVIRNIELLSIPQIELSIRDFALKARDGKISVDDLNGGTFSITNGGVFGSLLSTPILNPPQSAILGMHKMEDRAVVIESNGKKEIQIRTMMYVALSYDHRMIDGKEAVSFLVKVKEGIEDPERLLIGI
ncbi:MAG: 2-oxoglutarate dehydrogenase complex dihydrolipoyllysine-residue succinyltransferase [Bdellovibrionaceae bacterium]|nr:2-oxoglutarate dehydrogenase complex dihydrolipoyllysine-residue succinyltransferase [Pseudobdellovibrionaceae bacterium]